MIYQSLRIGKLPESQTPCFKCAILIACHNKLHSYDLMIRALYLCLISLSFSCGANDTFNVLRDNAGGFAKVLPGKIFEFPADHGEHDEFRIEWWYLTANLKDAEGKHWGLQWTLFRQALSPIAEPQGWSNNQLWMAHAAISTPDGHKFEQRFSRGGIGQAGIRITPHFEAWIDDWVWRAENNSPFPAKLIFNVADQAVSMQLNSKADWILQGDAGYSQKSQQGQASYYYSQPNITIEGHIDGQKLSGSAWLDREWSSQPLAPNQQGWDWFSLHLNDGSKLMLYQLRHDDNQQWLSGSWIENTGEHIPLKGNQIELTILDRREIEAGNNKSLELPLEWIISLPGRNRSWVIKTLYDQQWMGASFPYWEGVVLLEDKDGNSAGVGYMELTGYE